MGLGPRDQRLLAQIERALHGSDPKLAGKLTMFTRLTSREEMPLRERVLVKPSRLVRFAPVAMAMFVLGMILVSVTVLSRIGPPAREAGGACATAWVRGCQAPATSAHPARSRASG